MENPSMTIREIETVEEMQSCVDLQRKVFGTPDLETSPVRHLVVTKFAGGFTLGAFDGARMVGFVLSVPMFKGETRAFYSHMTAVDPKYQNHGIGAKLKWAQRARALQENVKYIKWTFQPVQARNAFFNLERLGATIKTYQPNFYGTDYLASETRGIDSDRLFADWFLDAPKVVALSNGESFQENSAVVRRVEIPNDWNKLVSENISAAIAEQERIKREFQEAFDQNLVCKGFEKSATKPAYLLYKND